jgi:hypothetical protein
VMTPDASPRPRRSCLLQRLYGWRAAREGISLAETAVVASSSGSVYSPGAQSALRSRLVFGTTLEHRAQELAIEIVFPYEFPEEPP